MERPVLGLAYAKTAGDTWDLDRLMSPGRWWGSGSTAAPPPAKPATTPPQSAPTPAPPPAAEETPPPATEQPPPEKAQQNPQAKTPPPAAVAAPPPPTPAQQRVMNRTKLLKQRQEKLKEDRAKRLAYAKSPAAADQVERDAAVTKQIQDARTTREGGENSPTYFKNEQARREQAGNWAWQSAQGLGRRTMRGAPTNPRRATGTPGYEAAGMTSYDLAHGVNRYSDNAALEGQGSRGMGDDEFQRYMGKYYPEQAAASRAKYDKPEIQWGEKDPMFQVQGTSGKKPIEWQPTTYEQAQRMGVLNGSPYVQSAQLQKPPSRTARAFTTEAELKSKGVDPNGPQGWRYDEARRNNPINPGIPNGPAASAARASDEEQKRWDAWNEANPEPELPQATPDTAQPGVAPPEQAQNDIGSKVPLRVPPNRPSPGESRTGSKPQAVAGVRPIMQPYQKQPNPTLDLPNAGQVVHQAQENATKAPVTRQPFAGMLQSGKKHGV